MTPENPPAFPCEDAERWYSGMTLRDYFAAQALIGEMVTTCSDATPRAAAAFIEAAAFHGQTPFQRLAANAYQIADAMLAEREKQL